MYKNFIIQNGKVYLEKDGKAYEVKFNPDLTIRVTDTELDNISTKERYFLNEVKAKLNVKSKIANSKKVEVQKPKVEPKVEQEVKEEQEPKNKNIKEK